MATEGPDAVVMSEPAGKYALFELERRFLVGRLPDDVSRHEGWRIVDRYIENTHLRLRRMEPTACSSPIFKLGQKHVPSEPDFSRMTITNMYLSRQEYDTLSCLRARELRKARRLVTHEARIYNVDAFEGNLAGLVLAETSFETEVELSEPLALPPWIVREVSNDIRFTGGALASLTGEQARALISGLG